MTRSLRPRSSELLARLAVQPAGASKDALIADLWPHAPGRNALAVAVSRARADLEATGRTSTPLVVTERRGGHRLDADLVEVDLWALSSALRASRSPGADPIEALEAITMRGTGPFAADLDSHWAAVVRDELRLEIADVLAALTAAMPDHAAGQALHRLIAVWAADPGNQALCREIMRIQARLGHHNDIPQTFALLTARLATRHATPDQTTSDLVHRLSS